jgi:hypothetical protein
MTRVVCMMCHRAIEAAGFGKFHGAMPAVQLERERERSQLRTRLPPHSMQPATGN